MRDAVLEQGSPIFQTKGITSGESSLGEKLPQAVNHLAKKCGT